MILQGLTDRHLLEPVTKVPRKNALGWNAVVPCEGELIILCEIEFSMCFFKAA
jgi:hypothetical protein